MLPFTPTATATATASPLRPIESAETDRTTTPWWARHSLIAGGVTVALALVAVACGEAPAEPGAASPEKVEAGSALYQANCASCHGTDLRGTDRGPAHLSIVYEPDHHGDDAFRSAIVNGARQHHWNFGDMAPVAGLDDDEISAIIDFVRSEQIRQGFEP